MNNFQTILTAIFLAFFVFAVLIFSGVIKVKDSSSSSNNLQGKITVWGTLRSPNLYKVFETATGENRNLYINYVQKPASTYQQSLIEAFASDQGPDLFFITPDMIIRNQNFFYKIPYTSYPKKVYMNSFIDGADIFLDEKGIIALPLVVDPMVMYYNKNMLSNVGIASPPKYWNQLFNLNDKLTKKLNDGTILKSMIALGRYDNINNARGILSTLILQSKDNIIQKEGSKYILVLDKNSSGSAVSPFETILNFLVEFSTPSSNAYSWNRSISSSRNFFTGGKLALYLGKASELFRIQSSNPNLSFNVAEILQTKNGPRRTFGNIYALAINKKTKKPVLAFEVSSLLSSAKVVKNFSKALSLPPALKSLLSKKPENPYMYTFYNSAIITHSWMDPNPIQTDVIFNELFNNILSNRLTTGEAIIRFKNQLNQTLK